MVQESRVVLATAHPTCYRGWSPSMVLASLPSLVPLSWTALLRI